MMLVMIMMMIVFFFTFHSFLYLFPWLKFVNAESQWLRKRKNIYFNVYQAYVNFSAVVSVTVSVGIAGVSSAGTTVAAAVSSAGAASAALAGTGQRPSTMTNANSRERICFLFKIVPPS